MLSVFPEILFLSPLAATIIRCAVALLFVFAAYAHAQRPELVSRVLAFIEMMAAVLLFAGAWSQPAALLGAVVAGIWYFQPNTRVYPLSTIFLAVAMCISVLLTGAGAFAFDLPL